MTDEIHDLIRSVDRPRQPTPDAESRMRDAIARGLDDIGPALQDWAVLTEAEAARSAPHDRARLVQRLVLATAALLLAVGSAVVLNSRSDPTNNRDERASPNPEAAADIDATRRFCTEHIDPIITELELWKGTFNYVVARSSDQEGPLETRLRDASAALVDLRPSAEASKADISNALVASRSANNAESSELIQQATRILSDETAALQGANRCQLDELEAALG